MKKQVAKDGGKPSTLPMESIDEDTMLDEAQFLDLIKCIDKGLRALPATGQVGCLHLFMSLNTSHAQWGHGLAWQLPALSLHTLPATGRWELPFKTHWTVRGFPAPSGLPGLRALHAKQH